MRKVSKFLKNQEFVAEILFQSRTLATGLIK